MIKVGAARKKTCHFLPSCCVLAKLKYQLITPWNLSHMCAFEIQPSWPTFPIACPPSYTPKHTLKHIHGHLPYLIGFMFYSKAAPTLRLRPSLVPLLYLLPYFIFALIFLTYVYTHAPSLFSRPSSLIFHCQTHSNPLFQSFRVQSSTQAPSPHIPLLSVTLFSLLPCYVSLAYRVRRWRWG